MLRATAEDRRMIRETAGWGCWPLLPMKRKEEGKPQEMGFIYDSANNIPPVVFLGNMFAFIDGVKAGDKTPMKDRPKKEYTTWEALWEDGWVVD